MTTANLAEQLLAIGRQLQAMERRLTHLPALLEFPPALQQLLTDPLARLADLLRPLANWPAPQPTPDELTPALAPWRSSPPASQSPAEPLAGGPLLAAEAFTGWSAPRWLANHGQDSRPLPTTPAAVDAPLRWWSAASETPQTSLPSQGTRLTRERSALLSILQSNMAPAPAPPAVTGTTRAPAAGAGRSAVSGAADMPRLYTVAEPVTVSTSTQEDGATASTQKDGATAMPRLEATGEGRFVSPAPVAERTPGMPGRQPGAGNGGVRQRSAELPVGTDATAENFPALPPPVLDPPHPWTPSAPNVDTRLHPPQGDETFRQGMAGASQALPAVQLEQIMEALVERLELTLLRAYGTTGA